MGPSQDRTTVSSVDPTANPSKTLGSVPSSVPTGAPLVPLVPISAPSVTPTHAPQTHPSEAPSAMPTSPPSKLPSPGPSVFTSEFPSFKPSASSLLNPSPNIAIVPAGPILVNSLSPTIPPTPGVSLPALCDVSAVGSNLPSNYPGLVLVDGSNVYFVGDMLLNLSHSQTLVLTPIYSGVQGLSKTFIVNCDDPVLDFSQLFCQVEIVSSQNTTVNIVAGHSTLSDGDVVYYPLGSTLLWFATSKEGVDSTVNNHQVSVCPSTTLDASNVFRRRASPKAS